MNKWLAIACRSHYVIVPGLLIIAAILAFTSLIGDSITFDEMSHLTSGYSYLKTGDFRLAPDHPPLAKMWAAWPLLLIDNRWPGPDVSCWRKGNYWMVGQIWLYELNKGEMMLTIARCMMVILLLVTCLCIYGIGRGLFGPEAGLLALTLAVLSPTFLAHGRLVTTDLPVTLGVLITLLAFAQLLNCLTWGRLVLAALALSALSLTKFSWLTVLPALVLMFAIVVFRRNPPSCLLFAGKQRIRKENKSSVYLLRNRFVRVGVILLVSVIIAITVWAAIWTCFGWRYSPFRGADQNDARMLVPPTVAQQLATTNMKETWEAVLTTPQGEPMRGLTVDFIRWVHGHRLLPEAYIYGLAFTLHSTRPGTRIGTLMGKVSTNGYILYFPIAFAIKTPIATMLLLVAGLSVVITRRMPIKQNLVLAAGLIGFTAVYGALAIKSHINIGHRHLLPIYPTVMIFAGASVGWLRSRLGKLFIFTMIGWLICANLWIHPHYLSYFNEFIGGPSRGHLYLTDSNIDWGQDLKRLAKYAKNHPNESIKLAYFGSSEPLKYGFECEKLCRGDWSGSAAELTAGTYVLSIMHMFGYYDLMATDIIWSDKYNQELYRKQYEMLIKPLPVDVSDEERQQQLLYIQQMKQAQQGRLVNRLRQKPPDERIGYSLFVYRLTQEQVDELVRP